MRVETTEIAGVLIVTPAKFGDERGFLSETFKQDALRRAGVQHDWVQENHVFSAARGVVRGLHWQNPPFAQAKLVRAIRGAIYDVAVDLRNDSPSYGSHVGVELSANNWRQLYVPAGFAHGYCTLTGDTEVTYRLSAAWEQAAEAGLRWDDPDLAIAWPIADAEASLNARDLSWPSFGGLASPF